jgi:hypothetical protein
LEYGPALNQISKLGPDSKSGVPLENLSPRPHGLGAHPKGRSAIKFFDPEVEIRAENYIIWKIFTEIRKGKILWLRLKCTP